jgi:tRNA-dihydrouridine synthase B
MNIGSVSLKNNVCIAPLAGISDLVFRELMVEYGAGLVATEMISVAGLSRRDKKTLALTAISERERPVAVQIFGNKPEEFYPGVQTLLEKIQPDIIDINMGCPVRKVVASGSGSALLKDLPRAKKIIQETVRAAAGPVTVKFRLGWDSASKNFLELAAICEGEGVAAVALHARTRAQEYSGTADWSAIAQLKQAVKIPVFGNGDVKTRDDYLRMLAETGCDGVMIGRAAMGNPWLIKSIAEGREIVPTKQERIAFYLEHARRQVARYGQKWEEHSICKMRKFAHKYINGFDGASELRQKINIIKTLVELEKLLLTFNDNPAVFR